MHSLPYHLIYCSAITLQIILLIYLADSVSMGA